MIHPDQGVGKTVKYTHDFGGLPLPRPRQRRPAGGRLRVEPHLRQVRSAVTPSWRGTDGIHTEAFRVEGWIEKYSEYPK